MAELHGWQADPLGTHEHRYFAHGQPTTLVRDHGRESCDPPPQFERGAWQTTSAQNQVRSIGAAPRHAVPELTVSAQHSSGPMSRPAATAPPGWWLASDGNWYPPELAPATNEPEPVAPVERPAAEQAPVAPGHPPNATAPPPGWWLASDGNWYPPELAPGVPEPSPVVEAGPKATSNGHESTTPMSNPPAPGWWLASDGNWYPPELAPR